MAQIITQNGVIFNSVKTDGIKQGGWPFFLAGQQGPDEDGGIINAVDIDWNDADWSSITTPSTPTTIRTTGDLISAINMHQQSGTLPMTWR